MITVPMIALILLIIRLVSVALILSVMVKQIGLFKRSIDSDLASFRIALFLLNLVALIGGIIPIYADFYYAFVHQGSGEMNVLVVYAVSNALVYLAGATLVWKVYQIAGKQLDSIEKIETPSVEKQFDIN